MNTFFKIALLVAGLGILASGTQIQASKIGSWAKYGYVIMAGQNILGALNVYDAVERAIVCLAVVGAGTLASIIIGKQPTATFMNAGALGLASQYVYQLKNNDKVSLSYPFKPLITAAQSVIQAGKNISAWIKKKL